MTVRRVGGALSTADLAGDSTRVAAGPKLFFTKAWTQTASPIRRSLRYANKTSVKDTRYFSCRTKSGGGSGSFLRCASRGGLRPWMWQGRPLRKGSTPSRKPEEPWVRYVGAAIHAGWTISRTDLT